MMRKGRQLRQVPIVAVAVAPIVLLVTALIAVALTLPGDFVADKVLGHPDFAHAVPSRVKASGIYAHHAGSTPAAQSRNASSSRALLKQAGGFPLFFEANVGQTNPRVRYFARAGGYVLFLTPDKAVFALNRPRPHQPGADRDMDVPRVVQFSFDRVSRDASLHASDETAGKVNYLIGRDPRRWHRGVPTYLRVTERHLWPGIDLVYHGSQGRMELDLMVAPGADPRAIRLALEGVDKAEIDSSGALSLNAAGRQLTLLKPGIYQILNGSRKAIAGTYVIHRAVRSGHPRPEYKIGFRLASYDRRHPLIIDPVVAYKYVSYLGGSLIDIGDAVAVDQTSGHVYVSGQSDSPDFPVSGTAYQKICKGCGLTGAPSAFVAEINPNVGPGNGAASLVYATFLGGSGNGRGVGEEAFAVATDSKGNAYLGGYTYSADFPLVNPFQNTCTACGSLGGNAFVSELNYDGSKLLYSTYLGGSGGPNVNDAVLGIAVDSSGNVDAGGVTPSNDFPTSAGALGTSPTAAPFSGFFSILNPSVAAGSQLVYSTYLGSGVGGIAVDAAGDAYVSGAAPTGLPTHNAYQSSCPAGGTPPTPNSFAAEFAAGTHALVYSTYLCGAISNPNGLATIAVDKAGNIYLTGTANSTLTTTPNAPQPKEPSGPKINGSAFAAELNPSRGGTAQLVFSTFIGGSGGGSFGRAIAYGGGQIYVTGGTNSPNLLLTHSATQKKCGDPACSDTFVTVLDPSASTALGALVFSSYFGANGSETGAGVGVDAAGNFTIVGASSSSNLPTTLNALKATCPTCGSASRIGGFNAWIASYSVGAPTLVQGDIYDVVLNYPKRTFPVLNIPLAGATVQLLDDKGALIAADTTDSSGYYELDGHAPPGTYTVEVTKLANVYSSSSNSYAQEAVKQLRTVTLSGTAPVVLNLNLPVSIVNEAAADEYTLNNPPAFKGLGGLLPNNNHYDTTAVEAHVIDILRKNPPTPFTGLYAVTGTTPSGPKDDWNSLIRINVAMETLGERNSNVVAFANDASKAAALYVTLAYFRDAGFSQAVFPKIDPSIGSAIANATKISLLAFGVKYIAVPILRDLHLSAAQINAAIEIFAKTVRFGADYLIGSSKEDLAFEAVFQGLTYFLFNKDVGTFISMTQPSLDTAAIQFEHNAISGDTQSTLEAIDSYDTGLSNLFTCIDSTSKSLLTFSSVIRGFDGLWKEWTTFTKLSSRSSVDQFELASDIQKTAGPYVRIASTVAVVYAAMMPTAGIEFLIAPTGSVITAAMTGAAALGPPVPPMCPDPCNDIVWATLFPKSCNPGMSSQGPPGAMVLQAPAATSMPTSSPAVPGTATPTPTPLPLPPAVQGYMDELGEIGKILGANDIAAYNAETTKLVAANGTLFSYLNPINQRASGALSLLSPAGADDAELLTPQYASAAGAISLLYTALELWTQSPSPATMGVATSSLTDTMSAVMAAGQQAALVQSDLKGITVPGQIVIGGDGVPGELTTPGSVIHVEYTFTNVGDQPAPAGTITLVPGDNVALITAATVSLPPLAPGGVFLGGWQFQVSSSAASPVDFGHYQIAWSVAGAQFTAPDDIFWIISAATPTPSATTTSTPTPARSATPKPTASIAATITPARTATPKPTPTRSPRPSATPTGGPTPPALGSKPPTGFWGSIISTHLSTPPI